MTFPVFSAGTSAYNLTRSLRFRSSATAYLNRTPASAGNRTTWTWSAWVKRSGLENNALFIAGTLGSNDSAIYFGGNGNLDFYTRTSSSLQGYIQTPAVFRDVSAWYHVVAVYNSGNATSADRMILYINGTRQTVTINNTVPQNTDSFINSNVAHFIGSYAVGYPDLYLNGYLTEVNFIDGQALTPSSFGSTNPTTGVWQPAKYAGTYGTNGFYLPFTNTTSTTTLGNDFSGNSNNWTTNNISLTPGATYDSMTDVPTLTSATAANFAVLNPLGTAGAIPTNGNLSVSSSSTVGNRVSTILLTSGKWYWEGSGLGYVGAIIGVDGSAFTGSVSGSGSKSIGYWSGDGLAYWDGGNSGSGTFYSGTDVIGVALDMGAGNVKFYKNNTLIHNLTFGSGTVPNLSSGVYAGYNVGGGTRSVDLNFGQRPFAYTPPSGFLALNTFNLPSSTIPAGNKFMDATLYTGTGSSLSVTNSGSMQPDWVWIKSRSAATDHALYDVLRGTQSRLESNTSDAEVTSDNGVTAFGTGGFTVGTLAQVNTSSATYVGWQWKANGAGVTNTAGSITSTVSANTTSGFSVVTYTGTGTTGTIGHGLGVAPSFIIVKPRNNADEWYCYHASLGATQRIQLNQTSGSGGTSLWNSTAPTSSVYSAFGGGSANVSGWTIVAYCFAPIAGFSAFGSYTGNGSTDGPFIYTGFRPRWVMIKNATTVGTAWLLLDTAMNPSNNSNIYLNPNLSDAQGTDNIFDVVSNGFKLRNSFATLNGSGDTFIYASFAENPFKNALAR
jgi:hypothetical protein